MTTVLAFDLGASNGRLVSQVFNGEKISLQEIHRFSNQPLQENGHYYWDFNYLMKEIVEGIRLAEHQLAGSIDGIGVDTWGVDFGIINANDQLVSKPFSYRDTYTVSHMERALAKRDAFELFTMTGNEVSSINTLFQLMAIEQAYPAYLDNAKHILMTPNLIQFALTGIAQNEFTIASTSQLVEKGRREWHQEIMQSFFHKPLPLAPIQLPHQVIGTISTTMQDREQLGAIPVIMTPGHDTACALSALPIQHPDACFMSIGTWTLVGKEVPNPVITLEAFEEGFTNEGTSEGAYRFQRNGMGFWILQNLRNEWKRSGREVNYDKEHELLTTAPPNDIFIDPDDALFFNPSSMEEAIQLYCQKTHQPTPSSQQGMIQCVIESMALKYAHTIRRVEDMTTTQADVVYIGGGGIQNQFLCQLIANATGKRVVAGPIEASAIGNGLSQLRALGEIATLEEGREVVLKSFEMREYDPEDESKWQHAKDQFSTYINDKRGN
ncbi:rhamnulokinase family protein [Sporosarcina sp. NPDC096371]|uniref:rhamnulokinase n=1 Tax=Sporosarcina sp. NPDC096371 TaxID=3364530 RepID=UPI00381FD3EE